MNNDANTSCVQVFVWTNVYISLGLAVELLGHIVTVLSILRNYHTVFLSAPFSSAWAFQFPYALTNTWFWSVFFITVLLDHVRWNVMVLLICIALMTEDAERLFICLLADSCFWWNAYQKSCSLLNWVDYWVVYGLCMS